MKIAAIAYPSQIPPKGWGAVEILLWDYSVYIKKYHPGIDFCIFNYKDEETNINEVNKFKPDFIHIHNDGFLHLTQYFQCKRIIVTCHWGYLESIHHFKRDTDYHHARLMKYTINSGFNIFCVSPAIREQYIRFGADPAKIHLQMNGVDNESFKFSLNPKFPEKSLYLARIEPRKMQHVYQSIDSIYFAGNYENGPFDKTNPRWLGEWSKEELYNNLTEYGNLVLISDGEAGPSLAVVEGLAAGLGIVISAKAASGIDSKLPFVDLIPEEKLNDLEYVEYIISENRKKTLGMREIIREYAISRFGYKEVVKNYINKLDKLMI